MTYLWMISVGVTDIQFPVWKQNEPGEWTENFRFESGRKECRKLHEKLLRLIEREQIIFPDKLPDKLPGNPSLPGLNPRLELELIAENEFRATVFLNQGKTDDSSGHTYRISAFDDTIPNDAETKLPVYCAKLHELLDVARGSFGDQPVAVVVLGTKRDEHANESEDEPIASAPLVARFLADRLNLEFQNNQGEIPEVLSPGTSTWVDILRGQERAEDSDAQRSVVNRLSHVIRLWNSGISPNTGKIFATTSGGIPPLKPLLERIPATCLGQQSVDLLDKPAKSAPTKILRLNYTDRVIEQETIRFHCAEALRKLDYVTAYGLACRCRQPWAKAIIGLLGPLLELGNRTLKVGDQQIDDRLVLTACQIEISLCMGDSVNALRRLGVFIETGIWKLIETDRRILTAGLTVDRGEGFLQGNNIQIIPEWLREKPTNNTYKVKKLTGSWPTWLENNAGGQLKKATALKDLVDCYNGRERQGLSIRNCRNHLVHGDKAKPLDISDLDNTFKSCGLMRAKRQPFGGNFLSCDVVSEFIRSMDRNAQINSVSAGLACLTEIVIWG